MNREIVVMDGAGATLMKSVSPQQFHEEHQSAPHRGYDRYVALVFVRGVPTKRLTLKNREGSHHVLG